MIFSTNEIMFRTNEILFRTNEIKKITTLYGLRSFPYNLDRTLLCHVTVLDMRRVVLVQWCLSF